jgi:hypothetical protein
MTSNGETGKKVPARCTQDVESLLPRILDVEVYKSRAGALEQGRIAKADVGDEPRLRLEGEGLLQGCGGVSGQVFPSAVKEVVGFGSGV